jgi:hypothetical protein
VPSTCTSRQGGEDKLRGFSAIELLIGLGLTVCLALAVCPLWTNMGKAAAARTDMSVAVVQSRVAVARLERDLRLSSAAGCRFTTLGPVLQASNSQVVFLQRTGDGLEPVLVEWELSGRALMRRWRKCPAERPGEFAHSLYADHKTMLEQLETGGIFKYVVDGVTVPGPLSASELASIEAVMLEARVRVAGASGSVAVATVALVGR